MVYNQDLLTEAISRTSFKSVANMLNGYELIDEQCIDSVVAIIRKRGIIMYETGLGKTLIASLIMKLLKREKFDRRFVFFVKKGQFIQTPQKISDATGMRTLCVTSAEGVVNRQMLTQDFSAYDVLLLTHECLNNPEVMFALYNKKDLYSGIFIDEAHELNNFLTASSSFMLRSLTKNFEYCYALTATPMTTEISQISNLCHIVDRELCPYPAELTVDLKEGFGFPKEYKGFLLSRTRKDLGIESNKIPIPLYVKAMPHQAGASGNEMFKITKGPGAYDQANILIKTIKSELPNRGLVYINQHIVRAFVETEFYKAGIKYACINGNTSLSDRKFIIDQFELGELNVIITSVTTSNDLDCDYVFFYEFCVDVKQMIGRAERGLNPKNMKIYYCFTTYTDEIEYFIRNIYNRSIIIQGLLSHDYSEIVTMGNLVGG